MGVADGASVGIEVEVAVGVQVNVGVAVGSGAKTEQEDKRSANSRKTERINLFGIGCILPLVMKITGLPDKKLRIKS